MAKDRFRATETRALLEIDRERGVAAKLQKELDASRVTNNQVVERLRSEATALQAQLGDLRQKSGMLEGSLQAVTTNRDMTLNELKGVQVQLTEMTSQIPAF